jgi:hypothetical protein
MANRGISPFESRQPDPYIEECSLRSPDNICGNLDQQIQRKRGFISYRIGFHLLDFAHKQKDAPEFGSTSSPRRFLNSLRMALARWRSILEGRR